MVCARKKNEPRTVSRLYGTRGAITIKYMVSIASHILKIKGDLL